jgi:hypothetical protein
MNVDVPVDRRARMRRIEVNPWRVSRTVERRVQVTRSATVVNQPTCVHQPSVSSLNSVTVILDRRVVSNWLRLKGMMSAGGAKQNCNKGDKGFHERLSQESTNLRPGWIPGPLGESSGQTTSHLSGERRPSEREDRLRMRRWPRKTSFGR